MSAAREEELGALLTLRLLPAVGDRITGRLLAAFGSAREALAAPLHAFAAVAGRDAAEARAHEARRARERALRTIDRARGLDTALLGRGLPGYPDALLELDDPPPILFLRGRRELLDVAPRVAVVGTRRATAAGRRFAGELGRAASHHGVPLVSGLALGIDAAAHRGALQGPASTVAVLGTGIDRTHPRSHRRLQETIAREGLLVSEFPPGEEVRPHHFPRRNRILAALGKAVVVVEAGARSGALITVDHALDIGRDVYAVPGAVELSQAKGTNRLLQDGARMLADPEDLFRYWVLEGVDFPGAAALGRSGPDGGPVVPDPLGLLLELGSRPEPVDLIARRLRVAPERLLQALSELELLGAAVGGPEGWRAGRAPAEEAPRRRTIQMKQLWLPDGEG